MNILAIDIGGTMIKYGLVSSEGQILSNDKIDFLHSINVLGILLTSSLFTQKKSFESILSDSFSDRHTSLCNIGENDQ